MFVLAVMPVEIVLADTIVGCNHEAETMSMADMLGHDMSHMSSMTDMAGHDMNSMDSMAMANDHDCCHGDCHCAACSGANCGVVHPISLMDPTIQNTDLSVMHSLLVNLYTPLHSGLFAQSLYRPPRS